MSVGFVIPARQKRIQAVGRLVDALRMKERPKNTYSRLGPETIDPERSRAIALQEVDKAYGKLTGEFLAAFRNRIADEIEKTPLTRKEVAARVREIPLPEFWGPDDPQHFESPMETYIRQIFGEPSR